MKRVIFVALIFTYLVGCRVKQEDAIGLYVSRNGVNTIDSLWINSDNHYINRIYRKVDRSIIYENKGSWKYNKGYIIFTDFYTEEDEVHTKEESNFENVLMTSELPLERQNGKVIIHHKSVQDDVYLEKID